MDNVTRSSKSVTYTILDGIMSVATLLISIAIFEHFLNGEFLNSASISSKVETIIILIASLTED